jgi:hypothetical protein
VSAKTYVPIDFTDSGYPARIWLYIFCGLLDAMWQTTAYWLMGAMSNDLAKLAYLTGFCAHSFDFFLFLLFSILMSIRQVSSVSWSCWYLAC